MRPSWVSTSNPVESISSRPAGARPFRCAAGIRSALVVRPRCGRSASRRVDGHPPPGRRHSRSACAGESSPGSPVRPRPGVIGACVRRHPRAKFRDPVAIDEHPAERSIKGSASRREQRPCSLMRLDRRGSSGFSCLGEVDGATRAAAGDTRGGGADGSGARRERLPDFACASRVGVVAAAGTGAAGATFFGGGLPRDARHARDVGSLGTAVGSAGLVTLSVIRATKVTPCCRSRRLF